MVHHTITRILGKRSNSLADRLHRRIVQQVGKDYEWHGNVRELEQCVRRLLLSNHYTPYRPTSHRSLEGILQHGIAGGTLNAQALVAGYCWLLYKQHGTYEAVARRTRLDRRTAKKHIENGRQLYR